MYLALLLILTGIAFYYREDIYKFGETMFRRKPDNSPSSEGVGGIPNPDGFIEEPINRNIFERIKAVFWPNNEQAKLKQIVKDRFNGSDLESIKLNNVSQETLKPQYTSRIEPVASSSKVTLDEPDTVLKSANIEGITNRMVQAQITGESYLDFHDKSETLMAHINTFLACQKINSFPTILVQQGLYRTIRASLLKLSMNERWYNLWLTEPTVENKIDEFIRIESDVYGDNNPTIEDVDNGSDSSKTWSDVSEKQSTPQQEAHPLETVENEEVAIEKPKAKVDSLFDRIKARREAISPSTELLETENVIKQEPNIKPKPKFNSWLDEIRSRRNDAHVVGSPIRETVSEIIPVESEGEIIQDDIEALYSNYSVDELQTQNYRSELSPILTESISQPVKVTETSENQMTAVVESQQTTIDSTITENKNSFTNLFKDIKSKRIEYGTPVIENNKGLVDTGSKSVDNLFDDTAALFEEDDTLVQEEQNQEQVKVSTPAPPNSPQLSGDIMDWKDVKIGTDGSIVSIELGNLWKECKMIEVTTNNRIKAELSFDHMRESMSGMLGHLNQEFDLKDHIPWKKDTKILGVTIVTHNNNVIPLYKNKNL